MDTLILAVFVCVYVGMMLGRWPGLAIDRTGVALLGAIVLLATGRVSLHEAWQAIDASTLALLLGLMVVSAQFRLAGVYSAITHRLAASNVSPPFLLFMLIMIAGGLSAVLANDIVCLAMAPLLIEGCSRRGLRVLPFLLGLACAANVGSAATLIGNPQNMLIGQRLSLSFGAYLLDGILPATLGCVATWVVLSWQFRDCWTAPPSEVIVAAPPFNHWQCAKGLLVLGSLITLFLLGPWSRETVALAGAAVLLMSRRMHSREMLALVDWQLLVLFAGLFVINHALAASSWLTTGMDQLAQTDVDVRHPAWLFGSTVVLSNLVSNVPAVMLLLPAAEHPQAGAILALASTLAGNLIIVGSIANIIVVDQAARLGTRIPWLEHARSGVPITLVTLVIAAGWLWLRAASTTL
jgi:Na+/H+ antiporter NhaD/arsenite permease-like protein